MPSGYYYYNPAYNSTGSYVLPPTADNLGFPVKRENGELYYDDYGYPYVWNASVSAWMIPEVKITATMQEKNYGDKVPFLYRGTTVIAETMKTDEGWILLPINYNNGGSPDYTYLPDFPSVNVKDATDNPCIHNIVQKLFASKNNIFSTILNTTFGNNSNGAIFFSYAEGTLPGSTDGYTNPTTNRFDIDLNKLMIVRNSSQEYIAATIIHELLHAYLGYNKINGKSPGISPVDEVAQHEYIAGQYVDDMRDMIITLFPNFSPEEAEALAWGGLEGTQNYINQVTNKGKEQYKSQVNDREKNVNASNSWHGKPCP